MLNPNLVKQKRDSIIHNTIWSSNVKKSKFRNIIKNIINLKNRPRKIPKMREKIFKHFFKNNIFKKTHSENIKLECKIIKDKKSFIQKENQEIQKRNNWNNLSINNQICCVCDFCIKQKWKILPEKEPPGFEIKINSNKLKSLSTCQIYKQNWEILKEIRNK
jgi:hypothetical protein